jgi:hypothetical protein
MKRLMCLILALLLLAPCAALILLRSQASRILTVRYEGLVLSGSILTSLCASTMVFSSAGVKMLFTLLMARKKVSTAQGKMNSAPALLVLK